MSQGEEKVVSTLPKGLPGVDKIMQAKVRLKDIASHTPLMRNFNLSEQYQCDLYLKREDLQVVRSYKIRGAYNKMASMPTSELANGIVAASAGNHAQGVAFSCNELGVHGVIYMPSTTTSQKVEKVKKFGKDWVEVMLIGDTYDDAFAAALEDCRKNKKAFIPPFDDPQVIEGQGTVGVEILDEIDKKIDYVILPVGGGGLSAGVGSYIKALSPETKIIGIEPQGAPAMYQSRLHGEVVVLEKIDKFVDGAAVKSVGHLNFSICNEVLDDVVLVPEGKVCSTVLSLYNDEGIIVEPAGALTVAALDSLKDIIAGKTVVCVVSGGNNDIIRMAEIKERSLLYEGLKQYFMVVFPQRAGALKDFLIHVLGPNDDICLFEYTKKTNRENGPALVGIEHTKPEDKLALMQRMDERKIQYQLLNDNRDLFSMLV